MNQVNPAQLQALLDSMVSSAESRAADREMALRGLVAFEIANTKYIAPKAYRRIRNLLGQKARVSREIEELAIRLNVQAIMGELGLQPADSFLFDATIQELIDKSSDHIGRDVKSTLAHFRRILLSAHLVNAANGTPDKMAIQIAAESEAPRFKLSYVDAAGRKWSSQRYTEILFRSSLFSLANTVMAEKLIERGVKVVNLYDPDHSLDGTKIALTSKGLSALHPGSRALIVANMASGRSV